MAPINLKVQDCSSSFEWVWDVMSNQEVVDMVAVVIRSYDFTDSVSCNNGGAFQEAEEVLAVEAYVRGSSDNFGFISWRHWRTDNIIKKMHY